MKKNLTTLASGIGLGAALVYLTDPERGRRRRALVRDQLVSLAHETGEAIGPTARDLRNRAQGLVARTTHLFRKEDVPDVVLEQRVRARLGRFTSHPGSIEVSADQGRVTLRGPILAHELEQTLAAVRSVPGVRSVNNQLEVHKQPGDVPGLQGGKPRPGERPDIFQEYWAPTTRLLVGVGSGALALYGALRRNLIGAFLGSVGLGMLARALTNKPVKRLLGVEAGRRAVDVQKIINANAPVEEVYRFWSNFENFPRFMSHVREVKNLGNGRWRWTVDGPAGVPVSWNAVVTKQVENEVLAWRSEEGSIVGNAGIVRFQPNEQGGTRIDIKMTYNPPAGAVGHAVASFFGRDPKSVMDDDLVRFKTLIEQGKTTAEGETVTREELEQEGVSNR